MAANFEGSTSGAAKTLGGNPTKMFTKRAKTKIVPNILFIDMNKNYK